MYKNFISRYRPSVGLIVSGDGTLVITTIAPKSTLIFHGKVNGLLSDLHIYNYREIADCITNVLPYNKIKNDAFVFLQGNGMYHAVTQCYEQLETNNTLVIGQYPLSIDLSYFCGISRELIFQYRVLLNMCNLKPVVLTSITLAKIYAAHASDTDFFAKTETMEAVEQLLLPYNEINKLQAGIYNIYKTL